MIGGDTLMGLSHASHRLLCAVVDHFPACIDLQFDLDLFSDVVPKMDVWIMGTTAEHRQS